MRSPDRILIWGVPGVGKTTLAAQAPAPIFLCAESGANMLEVARVPFDDADPPRIVPATWQELIEGVRRVRTEKHDFRTFILDTLDAAEALAWRLVCEEARKKTIEEVGGGYGKGYKAALDKWRELLAELEALQRARGMLVILIAHGTRKTVKNPEGKDYDAWALRLQSADQVSAAGLVMGWADAVLFAQWESFTDGEGEKGKLISTGNRILRTQENGPWQAKNRHNLPPTLPLSWAALAPALGIVTAEELRGRITAALCGVADEELAGKVRETVKTAGDDVPRLIEIEKRLAAASRKGK